MRGSEVIYALGPYSTVDPWLHWLHLGSVAHTEVKDNKKKRRQRIRDVEKSCNLIGLQDSCNENKWHIGNSPGLLLPREGLAPRGYLLATITLLEIQPKTGHTAIAIPH